MSSVAEPLPGPERSFVQRTGLGDFLAWWTGELRALVPPAWRERFASRPGAFIAIDGGSWRELRPSLGRLVEAGRAETATLDVNGRRSAFRRLVAGGAGDAGNVWLVLPDEDALVRTITLPLAAEESLRDAVGFELDRFTPFDAGTACFDFRVIGRDAAAQRIDLELAAASRAVVDGRIAELREVGATVLGVSVGHELAGTGAPLNLLAPERRGRPAVSRSAIAARALAALALVLAVAAVIYPVWQKRSAVIELLPRVAAAKAGADVAERLGTELGTLAAEHNFMLAKKLGQYPMVVLLDEFSRLLPDNTWVQQLEVRPGAKGRDLQFFGETGSSSELIEVLEKSGLVSNATFKSPLTKGATPNTERFFVGAELKPRAIPDPIPEAALVPAASGGAASRPATTAPAAAVPDMPAAAPDQPAALPKAAGK